MTNSSFYWFIEDEIMFKLKEKKNDLQVKKQVFSCITFSVVIGGHSTVYMLLFLLEKSTGDISKFLSQVIRKKHARKRWSFAGGNQYFLGTLLLIVSHFSMKSILHAVFTTIIINVSLRTWFRESAKTIRFCPTWY